MQYVNNRFCNRQESFEAPVLWSLRQATTYSVNVIVSAV